MNGYDPLALSIWFHSIILGAVIPNAIVRAGAKRGAVAGEPGWISDEWAFVLFIIGALISMAIQQIGSGVLITILIWGSKTAQGFPMTHAILLGSEYVLFKRLFLGRKITL